jgi:hypothetical protein
MAHKERLFSFLHYVWQKQRIYVIGKCHLIAAICSLKSTKKEDPEINL